MYADCRSYLLEPILGIEIKCPQEQIGTVAGILSGKRGKLLNVDQKGVISIIQGEVPASETFDLSEQMRGGTAGKAMWNTIQDVAIRSAFVN